MASNGEKLAAWRKLKGLSQTQAAEAFGKFMGVHIAQGTWAPWETGKKSPDRENAPGLERFTDGDVRAADWPSRHRKRRLRKARPSSPPRRTGTDG